MAIPRGLPFASVSGISGIPVEFENRTITGVDALLKCGAVERDAASDVGVKVPLVKRPVACAAFSLDAFNCDCPSGRMTNQDDSPQACQKRLEVFSQECLQFLQHADLLGKAFLLMC